MSSTYGLDDHQLAIAEHGIYAEVRAERERAHAKHGDHSMEAMNPFDYRRFTILAEEVGEVAKEMNDAAIEGSFFGPERRAAMRAELIQVAAMATAWADSLTSLRGVDMGTGVRTMLDHLTPPTDHAAAPTSERRA